MNFYDFTVDGDYSEFGEWSACSVTCGTGIKLRTRLCNSPQPENGGRTCEEQGLGPATETMECIMPDCAGKIL